jgi:hypothetical protein
MIFFIVFGIVILAVVLALVINLKKKNMAGGALNTNICNPINIIASTKKCPCCAEEIKIDAVKCKNCGSLLNVFK